MAEKEIVPMLLFKQLVENMPRILQAVKITEGSSNVFKTLFPNQLKKFTKVDDNKDTKFDGKLELLHMFEAPVEVNHGKMEIEVLHRFEPVVPPCQGRGRRHVAPLVLTFPIDGPVALGVIGLAAAGFLVKHLYDFFKGQKKPAQAPAGGNGKAPELKPQANTNNPVVDGQENANNQLFNGAPVTEAPASGASGFAMVGAGAFFLFCVYIAAAMGAYHGASAAGGSGPALGNGGGVKPPEKTAADP